MAKSKADKPQQTPEAPQALTPEEEAEVEARFRESLKIALRTPARVADEAAQTPKPAKSQKKES